MANANSAAFVLYTLNASTVAAPSPPPTPPPPWHPHFAVGFAPPAPRKHNDESGYAVFQIPTTSTPQITYNTPSQSSGYLACNGISAAEDQYCKYNGYQMCECKAAGGRRRLLFGGLSYLRPNCQCKR